MSRWSHVVNLGRLPKGSKLIVHLTGMNNSSTGVEICKCYDWGSFPKSKLSCQGLRRHTESFVDRLIMSHWSLMRFYGEKMKYHWQTNMAFRYPKLEPNGWYLCYTTHLFSNPFRLAGETSTHRRGLMSVVRTRKGSGCMSRSHSLSQRAPPPLCRSFTSMN